MVETDVTSLYSTFRYSFQFLPQAFALAVGLLFGAVAAAGVLAKLLGVWAPVQS